MTPKKRVLIAEDAKTTREALIFLLSNRGYDVLQASNGQEALDAAQGLLPDLVILAGELQQMSGYDVYRRLKMRADTNAIPVLLLTAVTNDADFPTRTLPDPACLVSKPFTAHDLLQRVAKVLADAPACP